MSFSLFSRVRAQLLSSTGRLCLTLSRQYQVQAATFVCLTFIPTASNSQPAPNVTLRMPVISGGSGCATNVNNVTLGRLRRSTFLTITGTGFPTLGIAVTVGDEMCRWNAPQMQSSTRVVCYLPTVWNGVETGELLPVVIMDLWSAERALLRRATRAHHSASH